MADKSNIRYRIYVEVSYEEYLAHKEKQNMRAKQRVRQQLRSQMTPDQLKDARSKERAARQRQPEKRRASKKAWRKKFLATPSGRLSERLRRSIKEWLLVGTKSNARVGKFQQRLGYSPAQLVAHLERQFLKGMTWENYGTAWHIDHVVPLSSFKIESIDDPLFACAWALSNLRPLWAKDNIIKGAKRLTLL